MLENIKSSYIVKFIFSYFNEDIKLKLVKYNKTLQNKLDLNLIDYKNFEDKYIVYETNGKGIEYLRSSNVILYKGEFLNGERNGKGKEYSGLLKILIFEGEYLKGKRNGKGKEYNDDNELIFEGEYLNGKKWIGKGYDSKHNIIYNIKDGKGEIKEFNVYGKKLFEGEYLNGVRNGKGKEYNYDNELIFEGEYKNGKRWNGKGYKQGKEIIYELKEGKGLVKEYHNLSQKLIYKGEYLNGERNGKGKAFFSNSKFAFEGEYKNGNRWNGKGKEYSLYDQLIYEGEYLNGKRNKGKSYIKGRLEYEGEYLFGKKWNGKGYDENGNIINELINGNGNIKEYDESTNTIIFEGEYISGKKKWKRKRI